MSLFLCIVGVVMRRRTVKQLVVVVAFFALLALLMVVFMLVTKVCIPKVFGIIATTYSTAMFIIAMIMDIVSDFSICGLWLVVNAQHYGHRDHNGAAHCQFLLLPP